VDRGECFFFSFSSVAKIADEGLKSESSSCMSDEDIRGDTRERRLGSESGQKCLGLD